MTDLKSERDMPLEDMSLFLTDSVPAADSLRQAPQWHWKVSHFVSQDSWALEPST